ncbi:MAG: dihydroxyacetone kinase family protein, partial [Enterobacteriaceae bacterium]
MAQKEVISTAQGSEMIAQLALVISQNRDFLSEIDGQIGDGDHGINMAKGFALCVSQIGDDKLSLGQALEQLSEALMEGIGGSMGPLYGSLFMGMASSVQQHTALDARAFLIMLQEGLAELREISSAQVGDKCLMDTLLPAIEAFEAAYNNEATFTQCLAEM